MGYVGNQTTNAYTSLDKQTITGDGGTSYTLDHAVANANEIEVFVNNVRQEPSVAYTVSGTALTMTGNVAASDDFYVVFQGKAVGTVVPPDDSVTTARIVDGAVTSAKLAGLTSSDMPTGAILQVKSVTKTDTFSTTASTFTDVTGLSVSITPTSSSSKILVMANVMMGTDDANFGYSTIKRDSTVLLQGDAASNRPRIGGHFYTGSNEGEMGTNAMQYLDSPSTTSSVTYKVAIRCATGGNTYVNRSHRDADNSGYDGRGASTITVMEIAG